MKILSIKEEVNLAVIVYSGFMEMVPVLNGLIDMGWLDKDSTLEIKALKLEEVEKKIEARKKAFSELELPEIVKKAKRIKDKMDTIFCSLMVLDNKQEFRNIVDVELCLTMSRDLLCEKVKRLIVLNDEKLSYKLVVYSKLEEKLTLDEKGFVIDQDKYITCEEHVFYLNIYNSNIGKPELIIKKELTANEVLKIIQRDKKR